MQKIINDIAISLIGALAALFKMETAEFIIKFVKVEDQADLNRLLEILVLE